MQNFTKAQRTHISTSLVAHMQHMLSQLEQDVDTYCMNIVDCSYVTKCLQQLHKSNSIAEFAQVMHMQDTEAREKCKSEIVYKNTCNITLDMLACEEFV
jgi:predicted DNA repair protein MutK